ncbi:MAG: MFS transporter [Candidatus Helarchaeota archaeon]
MSEEKHPFFEKFAYSLGQFSDTIAYQSFTYLIFTFYFGVIKINALYITIGFILWSIWNALNDPLIGVFSDKTKTKWGRRKPWIVAATVPLGIIMYFLFTPIGTTELAKFTYFFIIIVIFDGVYTAMSLNLTALFPEMYITEKERASVNSLRRYLTIVGLIVAYIIPTLIIEDLTNKYDYPYTEFQYQITGAVLGGILLGGMLITILWGIKERKEFRDDALKTPNFFKAIKYTLKNKSFLTYVVAGLMNWYVFGILPMVIPFYGTYVLGIEKDSIWLSILLLVAFLMSIPGIFIWKVIGLKIGTRKGFMISMALLACGMIPFMFISDLIPGLITMAIVGIGLAGSIYYIDIIISDIIDEDELKTGVRREGGYYGVNALIIRLSTILTIVTIGSVLSTTGWYIYDPGAYSPQIELGLRSLMFIFPALALGIGILALYFYPLHGKKLQEVREARDKLHKEKKARVSE